VEWFKEADRPCTGRSLREAGGRQGALGDTLCEVKTKTLRERGAFTPRRYSQREGKKKTEVLNFARSKTNSQIEVVYPGHLKKRFG